MMASEDAHGAGGLKQDALVEKLVPDPAQGAAPMKAFEGLLGKSAREGYWRLYLTSELNDYIEFKEEDVLNGISIPQEISPLLGVEATRVWLRRGTEIARTHTRSGRVEEVAAHLTAAPDGATANRACVIAQRCCDIFVAEGGDPRASACCGYVENNC